MVQVKLRKAFPVQRAKDIGLAHIAANNDLRSGEHMMSLYISTTEILKRYCISKGTLINMRKRQNDPFPKPMIKAHGRSFSRYGLKAVASWEETNGFLESLDIEPLISNLS